jgi:hypothetical protein
MEEVDFSGESNEKLLADAREKLQAACLRNDPFNAVVDIFNSYTEAIGGSAAFEKKKDRKIQKLQDEIKALKKSAVEHDRLKEQHKKLQAENKSLKEENTGLKRTVKGIKALTKMSEEKRSSILTMPKTIRQEVGASSSSHFNATALKYKQGGLGRMAIGPGAASLSAPPSILSFQASLSSGLSTLNSLVGHIPGSSSSRSADIVVSDFSVLGGSDILGGHGMEGVGMETSMSGKRKRAGISSVLAEGLDSDGGEKEKSKRGKKVEVPFPLLREALLRYKEIYGHMVVMKSFIVPFDNSWPDNMWGIKLGSIALRIRNMNGYKEHRDELVSACELVMSVHGTQCFMVNV